MEALVTGDGLFRLGRATWRCCHGKGGITAHKQEGDGATPTGVLVLRHVFYRADRVARPVTIVAAEALAPEDGWCDDPADPRYNQRVRLPYPGRHEALWRDDAVYDVVGVLGWNDAPVVPHRGSAIFLHAARPSYQPTEGCIALAPDDLRAALAAGLTAVRVAPGRG